MVDMNYYQFHIADWVLHTSHLTLEEEAVYRRLLDYYYDTETPIPEKTQPVIRRLRLGSYEETVALILEEFFVLKADGWHNLRADKEIADYNTKAETARANGKKGGRPKKQKTEKYQVSDDKKPAETQPVISGIAKQNPEETGSKANHKPLTINHNSSSPENPKKNKPIVEQKFTDDDMLFAKGMYKMILKSAPKTKKPNFDKWADCIRLMRERDELTHSEIATVFRFASQDEFWKSIILSPSNLREKFAQLDAKMRSMPNEKRNGNSADRFQIDHEDTSWYAGEGSCDSDTCEPDIQGTADDLHGLETSH